MHQHLRKDMEILRVITVQTQTSKQFVSTIIIINYKRVLTFYAYNFFSRILEMKLTISSVKNTLDILFYYTILLFKYHNSNDT